ncbi:uncharacterized protein LOC129586002 [Paramacrobiotus metropolitanus]|uniref:uncharacterized protein LOC129586002 n=1 Tax=Paramacrobiotus metropolitanus TaxID=2943436 RepID=UPI002445EC59|nr:uncharacterized protein LOC129586002 [Paramacrobiotus metropolitanus]
MPYREHTFRELIFNELNKLSHILFSHLTHTTMETSGIRSFGYSDSSLFCEIYSGADIYQWNAVDVPNDERLFERGLVINTVPDGVIVDFGVPGRRSQFVEYKKALHCLSSQQEHVVTGCFWDEEYNGQLSYPSSQASFEILARIDPDRPWTWYPAVFLVRRVLWNRYAYVQIQIFDCVVSKFVSAMVVRLGRRHRVVRAVGPDDYITRACPLPRKYRAGRSVEPALWNLWRKGLMSVHVWMAYPTCVRSGRLLYLQDRWSPTKLMPVSEEGLDRLNDRANAEMKRRLQAGWTFSYDHWLPPKLQPGTSPWRAAPVQGDYQMAAFPPELLRAILSSFATNERPFYRRVSPLWNAVIQQDDSDRCLTVNFGNAATAARSVGFGIVQYLTADTEMVAISNAKERWPSEVLNDCLRLISAVHERHRKGSKKLQVVVNRCSWDLANNRLSIELPRMAKACADAAAALERIIWRNCRFCGIGGNHVEIIVESDVTVIRCTLAELQTELYAMLKRHFKVARIRSVQDGPFLAWR